MATRSGWRSVQSDLRLPRGEGATGGCSPKDAEPTLARTVIELTANAHLAGQPERLQTAGLGHAR